MGEISKSVRFRILKRDGFRCRYCGKSADNGAVLHIDHKIPRCEGGSGNEDNLVTACADCNHGKGPHPGRSRTHPSRTTRDGTAGLPGYFFHSRTDGKIKWQGYIVSELPGERYLVRLLSWIDGLPCEDRLVRAEEVHKWSFYRTAEEMRYAWARESHMPTDRHIFAERAIARQLRELRDVQAERT